jgi:hypothetical protein
MMYQLLATNGTYSQLSIRSDKKELNEIAKGLKGLKIRTTKLELELVKK